MERVRSVSREPLTVVLDDRCPKLPEHLRGNRLSSMAADGTKVALGASTESTEELHITIGSVESASMRYAKGAAGRARVLEVRKTLAGSQHRRAWPSVDGVKDLKIKVHSVRRCTSFACELLNFSR